MIKNKRYYKKDPDFIWAQFIIAKALIIKEDRMLAIKIKDKNEEWYILPGGGQESEELLADTKSLKTLSVKIAETDYEFI